MLWVGCAWTKRLPWSSINFRILYFFDSKVVGEMKKSEIPCQALVRLLAQGYREPRSRW